MSLAMFTFLFFHKRFCVFFTMVLSKIKIFFEKIELKFRPPSFNHVTANLAFVRYLFTLLFYSFTHHKQKSQRDSGKASADIFEILMTHL